MPRMPTPQEKEDGLAHVRYEIHQFLQLSRLLEDGYPPDLLEPHRGTSTPPLTLHDAARNAFLDSFLLHLRNLLDFFELTDKSRYIRSSHYGFPPKDLLQRRYRKALNTYLAHITFDREDPVDWRIPELAVKALTRSSKFISYLQCAYFQPGDPRTPAWQALLDEIGTYLTSQSD